MTRLVLVVATAALFVSAASAFAATSTPVAPVSNTIATPTVAINYSARCTSLENQWKAAESTHVTNPNFGKAMVDAARGEKLCKSSVVSQHKLGASDYEAALKTLGVTPV